MGLLKTLFTNCAHPKGRMGRAMLKFMNMCHAPLTNWGLSLIGIQDGWTMLDIGCGGGATLQRLTKRSKGCMVYGIDNPDGGADKRTRCMRQQGTYPSVFLSVQSFPYRS